MRRVGTVESKGQRRQSGSGFNAATLVTAPHGCPNDVRPPSSSPRVFEPFALVVNAVVYCMYTLRIHKFLIRRTRQVPSLRS